MALTNFSSPRAGFGGGQGGPQQFGDRDTGALEPTPHDIMHVVARRRAPAASASGGLMSDPNCAALDPIFWLHHANIDRLVERLDRARRPREPDRAGWRDQRSPSTTRTATQVTMTGADVVDSAAQLGYVYDDVRRGRDGPWPRPPRRRRAGRSRPSWSPRRRRRWS